MKLVIKLGSIAPKVVVLILLLMLVSCQHYPATTDDASIADESRVIKVITSGGFAAAYNVLEPMFEAQTGIDLITSYGSSSGGAADSIPVRLQQGQRFDVLIMSQGSLDKMTDQGYVQAESRVDLVRSMIGMAVEKGAAKPDISTPENFIKVLVNADSIGYSASASGRYLSTKLWPEMGIWETIQSKSVRVLSERVATVVARGGVQIGFQQISEILPIEGADYAGPIPRSLQKVTTFSTGLTTHSTNHKDAKLLIEFLSSSAVAKTIAKTGLAPVILETPSGS